MAIRDDFTAGEVLAAADLNDTFASKPPFAYGTATPSTTVEGFIWYDENDTPPAPKFWDGSAFQAISAPSGLVHIATDSFSAVSSVSLNNVFTSAYDNYFLAIRYTASTTSTGSIKLRAATVDSSTGYFGSGLGAVYTSDALVYGVRYNNGTSANLTRNAGGIHNIVFDLLGVREAARTGFSGTYTSTSLGEFLTVGGVQTVDAAYDGITLLVSAGTMTGTIRVYGYQNS
jgi:hypothetical protein